MADNAKPDDFIRHMRHPLKDGLITLAGDEDRDIPQLTARFCFGAAKIEHSKFLTVIEFGALSFGAFAPDIQRCIAFSTSRQEVTELFKLAAESHLRELVRAGEPLLIPETTEIPGLNVGVQAGAITLGWTMVTLPSVVLAANT